MDSEVFGDSLAMLVVREINSARKVGDDERVAGVVGDLCEVLGKAIALVGQGERGAINAMLMAAENVIAEGAADVAALMASINQVKEGAQK